MAALGFALGAAVLLLVLGLTGLSPAQELSEDDARVLAALGIAAAALYATGLALGTEALARAGVRLRTAEEARYRLLARNMTDVIARHGRSGAVLFISPAAADLFGVPANELRGHGLFDRVHVADRPAYLTALSDAATTGENRSVEFRVRRDPPEPMAHPDGQFVWIEMRCRALDQVVGEDRVAHDHEVVAVMRDITRRKEQ